MTDAAIAGFGCAVTFIAAAGFYVFIHHRYVEGPEALPADPPKAPARAQSPPH